MKKTISTALVSGLIAVFALPAMAAPNFNDHNPRPNQHQAAPQHQQAIKPQANRPAQGNGFGQGNGNAHSQHIQAQRPSPSTHNQRPHQVQPHRDWRKGQVLNRSYRGNGYKVANYRQHPGLKSPGKNQRWVQVNGDYILINTLSNVIVSILTGR
ncbi:MAG: RcnB family protein [Vitreoscilla sp.]|nr:RcnB family protein [Vitreoscilla sp.]MBP9540984.1 RcnB family protein [Vitreoscilla sp.]